MDRSSISSEGGSGGGGGFSVHRYLEIFKELFRIAGIPMIRYGALKGHVGMCGARGFIFAECLVSPTVSRAGIKEIITGKSVKVSLSTTRYSTFYAGIRWLWPVRTRGMGSISCFKGSKKSIEESINVVFVILLIAAGIAGALIGYSIGYIQGYDKGTTSTAKVYEEPSTLVLIYGLCDHAIDSARAVVFLLDAHGSVQSLVTILPDTMSSINTDHIFTTFHLRQTYFAENSISSRHGI